MPNSDGKPKNFELLERHKWRPGQSGNPSGRSKKELVDQQLEKMLAADDYKEAKAIARLLIRKARRGHFRAIKLIVERTQGRPRERIELEGSTTHAFFNFATLSDEQLEARIEHLFAKLQMARKGKLSPGSAARETKTLPAVTEP